ncbi:hypothetical protein HKX48_002421 [Thoreauomyces humboldtii]|nr:hypothetical protein HKX48_002421 [Thoreauomyces humboldtii]
MEAPASARASSQQDSDAPTKAPAAVDIDVDPSDHRDKVLMAVLNALLMVDNRPCSPKELASFILKHKLATLGGQTPYATVSSRISQHFKRCAQDSRKPLLAKRAVIEPNRKPKPNTTPRKWRYYVDREGIPVTEDSIIVGSVPTSFANDGSTEGVGTTRPRPQTRTVHSVTATPARGVSTRAASRSTDTPAINDTSGPFDPETPPSLPSSPARRGGGGSGARKHAYSPDASAPSGHAKRVRGSRRRSHVDVPRGHVPEPENAQVGGLEDISSTDSSSSSSLSSEDEAPTTARNRASPPAWDDAAALLALSRGVHDKMPGVRQEPSPPATVRQDAARALVIPDDLPAVESAS